MNSTVRRIRDSLYWPLTSDGEAVLESFFSIPGVSAWNPERILWGEISLVFRVGHPLFMLSGNSSIARHKRLIGKAIERSRRPDLSLHSEVEAAALLAHWGLNPIFLKPTVTSPDLEAACADGQVVDVEVTRADQRRYHAATEKALSDLAQALQAGDVSWNIVCHMADASNLDELYAVLDAATMLCPNESAEVTGRWTVMAVPLERREDVVSRSAEFIPTWWPQTEPAFFVASTLLAGAETVSTHFGSLVPHASYLNPVLNKVNSGQHRPGHPYLIAVDTSDLPRAHERARQELVREFPVWEHVSGVLFFEHIFYVGLGRKVWIISLHTNPHALHPLPECVTNCGTHDRQTIVFHLSTRSIEEK